MSIRKLHIGGQQKKEGWEIFDANPGPIVDHVGNAKDLSQFDDNTFETVYASHVLEHFDYSGPNAETFFNSELVMVLKEWRRVLTPGGRLKVSVPDMDILTQMYSDRERFDKDDRYAFMRMIFGGHIDQYDYHYVGLNQELIVDALEAAQYGQIWRVEGFGLFDDTSNYHYKGTLISMNIEAEKPAAF